jgi:hypothetical protein
MPEQPNAVRRRAALIGVFLVALSATAARGQSGRSTASVTGTIVDEFGVAVQGVAVIVVGARLRVVTGERGDFKFPSIDSGAHRFIARRAGYRPDTAEVKLAGGDTAALWMELEHLVVTLGEVEVTATYESPRLRAFEDRRLRNIGGRFISPADIKAQAPTETSDLLRRVMGVRLADSSHVLIPVSNRGNKIVRVGGQLMSVPCVMRIAVNGFITDPSFSMNSISPMDIHGIEIYSGPASIPAEFNRTASDLYCGLIVIWTRSG